MNDPKPLTNKAKSASAKRKSARLKHLPAWLGSVMLATGCTPLGLLNGLDRITPSAEGARRVARGVAYGADARQKLDVWVPSRRSDQSPLPVVVFLYGGAWSSGSRGDYGFAGAAFAGQGFVAIVPDYRLVPQVRFPAFVEDGALAVRWARDHAAEFGGDPRRITLAGHSAGAYNAALLTLDRHYLEAVGVDPGTIRAAALLAGPYDWAPFRDMPSRNALGHWPNVAETQPISFARADAPPMLLATGTADRMVWPRNSQRLYERLESLGAPVELRTYPGVSHTDIVLALSRPFRRKAPALADSVAFLRAHSRLPTSPAR